MLESAVLTTLKENLPADWVLRVREKVSFSPTTIREALRPGAKYNKVIIDAAIEVAAEYGEKVTAEANEQKIRIEALFKS